MRRRPHAAPRRASVQAGLGTRPGVGKFGHQLGLGPPAADSARTQSPEPPIWNQSRPAGGPAVTVTVTVTVPGRPRRAPQP
jgi:hypothetical protein